MQSANMIGIVFKAEFERFSDLLEKQVELCPDELWAKKSGGFVFWQQIFHALACTEIFALSANTPSHQQLFSLEVAMLSKEADRVPSKSEILNFSKEMRQLAVNFFERVTPESLGERNVRCSEALKMERTNLHAMIALIRHLTYHLGCCDAILREHGLSGVY